ncbi:MAG: DUF1615 domain-containing protein [Panacagrimonas sp.]
MGTAASAKRFVVVTSALMLAACAGTAPREPDGLGPTAARALIARGLPSHVRERDGWTTDIYAAFGSIGLPVNAENACAVIAVIDQESTFRVDPQVPGLSAIAWREIEARAARLRVPRSVVRTLLKAPSRDGRSYAQRIDSARTERELSEIFEDLIGVLPGGESLFADRNPVRTGGPMQVSIAFAEEYAKDRAYPYPREDGRSLRREVFTRRGGLYFGVAHLLDYPTEAYDRPLFRFADFNAGHYASRNAAFQAAVSLLTGIPLALDGDLLREGAPADAPGQTELATRTLSKRLDLDDDDIRNDLGQGRSEKFEDTRLYERVFEHVDEAEHRRVPRAVLPSIRLVSPKITRKLTTEWFATRVQERHASCLERVRTPPPSTARA